MDREVLKKYDALKDEQADIRKRIDKLEREMSHLLGTIVSDTVMGTREDGTYGPIKIKGIPFPEYDKRKELLQQRLDRYEAIDIELAAMIGDIEAFIGSVQDSRIRTILRLKYIDGYTWRQIGRRYGGKGPSWAYQKIEKYFSRSIDAEKK